MTLAEKIIKQLRQNKDGGLNSEHLASAIAVKVEKVESAARSLQEQEHLLLGSDGCWYLGDALAAGGKYEPPPKAPEPVLEPTTAELAPDLTEETVREFLEKITPEHTAPPFGFQVKPPQKTNPIPTTNQFGALPAWARVKAWVNARSELATQISWTDFSKEIGIRKTTLGKARASLTERGETEIVAKLDRLVYREDSKSMRERAGVGDAKEQKPLKITWTTGPIVDDLDTLYSSLKKPGLPPFLGPLSDYLEMLDGFDLVCERQGLEQTCVLRGRIAELKAWLREFTQ